MTVSSTIVRDIIRLAGSFGVEPSALCALSNIPTEYPDDPDQRITSEQLDLLWQGVVKLTGDPFFGLHLGQQFNLNAIGVVGYLMQNSPHLGAALQQAQRYGKIIGDVLKVQTQQRDDQLEITFTPVPEWKRVSTVSIRQSIEYDMAFALQCFRQLTGKPLKPTGVWLAYEAAHPAEYEEVFSPDVQFGQPENKLVFPCHYLDLPIVTVHHDLLAPLEQFAQSVLLKLERQESVSSRVQQLVIRHMGSPYLEVAWVAEQLHMSKRTLQRKLQAEGQSFQKIIDKARINLATQYLQQGGLSISETAYLTGFSESAAFHRFFKQQTGQTPQQLTNNLTNA